jgi:hypothetical protein
MPYVRKGKVVYKKTEEGLKKVGESKSIATAKRYLKALYAHSKDK